ncbi:MAG TPA: NUDIX domain-containing protein [Tepidisphaeraceae bacterium]|jgi:dATP pyrophosphohydrolase|nr:NUDIX domain-containing protein [Tepidisphaeraceae bacterium]
MNIRHDMISCYIVRPSGDGSHQFLQLRRSPGKHLAGAWSTVRGKIEGDEKAWQAALRELREETGIVPAEFYQLDTVDIFYLWQDDTLWHCPGFCAVVAADVRITMNDEHDAMRWVSQNQIGQDFIWPGERAQLAELIREIIGNGPAKAYLRILL